MNTFKHIVFDIDGTLVNTFHPIVSALQKTANKLLGKRIPARELGKYFGIPGDETLRILGVPEEEVAGGMLIWHDYYYKVENLSTPFRGIREMLTELKKKPYILGIITSKTGPEYRDQFMRLGLGDFFDVQVFADDTEHGKPSPEPMLKYIERSGAKPEEILYIGDTAFDIECGQNAGVMSGVALWGCFDPNIKADYYFKKPNDVLESVRDASTHRKK